MHSQKNPFKITLLKEDGVGNKISIESSETYIVINANDIIFLQKAINQVVRDLLHNDL